MKDFDPYHAWLGIPPKDQPPHCYRLLGVEVFEAEAEVIENALERLRSHVTRHLGGPHKAVAQKLLRELAEAGNRLLDAENKAKYDEALRKKLKTNKAASPVAATPVIPLPAAISTALPSAKPSAPLASMQVARPAASNRAGQAEARPLRVPMFAWVAAGVTIVVLPGVLSMLSNGAPEPKVDPPAVNASETIAQVDPPRVDPPTASPPKKTHPQKLPPKSDLIAPVGTLPVATTEKPKPVPATTVSPMPVRPMPTPPALGRVPAELPPLAPDEIKTRLKQVQELYVLAESDFSRAVVAHFEEQVKQARAAGQAAEAARLTSVVTTYARERVTPKGLEQQPFFTELLMVRDATEIAYICAIRQAEAAGDQKLVDSIDGQLTAWMSAEARLLGDLILRYPDSQFRLINVQTQMAMSVRGDGQQKEAAIIQMKVNPRDPVQQWRVMSPGTKRAQLVNCKSGQVLNIIGAHKQPNVRLIQWPENGDENAFWDFQYQGKHYLIKSHFSGHYVAVGGGLRQENRQLIQYTATGTNEQNWTFVRTLPELTPK